MHTACLPTVPVLVATTRFSMGVGIWRGRYTNPPSPQYLPPPQIPTPTPPRYQPTPDTYPPGYLSPQDTYLVTPNPPPRDLGLEIQPPPGGQTQACEKTPASKIFIWFYPSIHETFDFHPVDFIPKTTFSVMHYSFLLIVNASNEFQSLQIGKT